MAENGEFHHEEQSSNKNILIDPQTIEGIPPEHLEVYKEAGVKFYSKENKIALVPLPRVEDLSQAGLINAEEIHRQLAALYSFLPLTAMRDKFDNDHVARRIWRAYRVLHTVTPEHIKHGLEDYKNQQNAIRSVDAKEKDKPLELITDETLQAMMDELGLPLDRSIESLELGDLLLSYVRKEGPDSDKAYMMETMLNSVRPYVLDQQKIDALTNAYNSVNQLKRNKMSSIPMNLQLLSRFLKPNSMDVQYQGVSDWLKQKGKELFEDIDQDNPNPQTKYDNLTTEEKLEIVRKYNQTIAEAIKRIIPRSLQPDDPTYYALTEQVLSDQNTKLPLISVT